MKMKKKVIAAVLIAVMGALTLSIPLQRVLAEVTITGYDYEYPTSPVFCECYHDGTPGDNDDTMAGLGVSATYAWVNNGPVFDHGYWMFTDQAGGSNNGGAEVYEQFTPMYCTYCVNGNQYSYYDDYTAPVWGTPPILGINYADLYVYLQNDCPVSNVASIEGETLAQFYQISNPSNTWWISAYTQNPNDPGTDWTFLTAWI
jgi:hypothetical protein